MLYFMFLGNRAWQKTEKWKHHREDREAGKPAGNLIN